MQTYLAIMRKKEKLYIVLIAIGALGLAFIINILLSSEWELIPSAFSKKEWFVFWTSYTTGVLAIIIGYLTIIFANRNSQRAIEQQTAILIRQKSDEVYKEIKEEINKQINLFNVVRFTSTTLMANGIDLSGTKGKVLEKKSLIAERNTCWALLKSLYLSSEYVSPITDEYDKVWTAASNKLETYANFELELFRAIEDEDIALKLIENLDKLLIRLNELKTSQGPFVQILTQISEYEKQKEANAQKKFEANKRMKELIPQLQQSIDELVSMREDVFAASVKFLASLSGFSFVNINNR